MRLADQTAQYWAEILRVNLIGAFLAIKHAAPLMNQRGGGSIICTASVAGLRRALAGQPALSGIQGRSDQPGAIGCSAADRIGIRANAICPGLIETGMTAPIYELARATGQEERVGELNRLGRGGAPEEIARAALFLASDELSSRALRDGRRWWSTAAFRAATRWRDAFSSRRSKRRPSQSRAGRGDKTRVG